MPTVSIHYGPDHALDAATFAALAEDMAELIEQWLGPERQKIQIMPIALAHPPLGRVAMWRLRHAIATPAPMLLCNSLSPRSTASPKRCSVVPAGSATPAFRVTFWWPRINLA